MILDVLQRKYSYKEGKVISKLVRSETTSRIAGRKIGDKCIVFDGYSAYFSIYLGVREKHVNATFLTYDYRNKYKKVFPKHFTGNYNVVFCTYDFDDVPAVERASLKECYEALQNDSSYFYAEEPDAN